MLLSFKITAVLPIFFLGQAKAQSCPNPTTLPCDVDLATGFGQQVQDIFKKYEGQSPFLPSAGTPDFVLCDLVRRVNLKQFCQMGRNSCGPTSVAQVAAEFAPLQFAEMVAEVYFTGKIAKLNYTMSPYLANVDFSSEPVDNMVLGALLIAATALRDIRNQYLTDLDPSTVPSDGYGQIQGQPSAKAGKLDGSSFFTTPYDVKFFYEYFGYETSMWLGSGNVCTACQGTVDQMFAGDLAAAKEMVKASLSGQEVPSFPWSPRATSFFQNPNEQLALTQFMSRLSEDGLKYACENAGSTSICINMGYSQNPPDTTQCNEKFCMPDHWVKLDSCDLTNDACQITSYGVAEPVKCSLLKDFTNAVVVAFEPSNVQGSGPNVQGSGPGTPTTSSASPLFAGKLRALLAASVVATLAW